MSPVPGTPLSALPEPTALETVAVSYARLAGGPPADTRLRRDLRERLVRAGLPLATRLAQRYRDRGEPLEDLIQVARVGLLKSVDRYDPERGTFAAFAAVTMLGELRRHIDDLTWGSGAARGRRRLRLEVDRIGVDLGREPPRTRTRREIADRLSATPEVARGVRVTVGIDDVEDRITVAALLCRLPARERRILALRFYGDRTQAQIAAELGISQVHVSRLLSRALGWLRAAVLSDDPWPAGAVPAGHQLSVHSRRDGRTVVVEVTGEVDRDTADQLRGTLRDAVGRPAPTVVVRLDRVPFVDAAGLAVLADGHRAARGAGGRLTVTGAGPQVVRAIRATGLAVLLGSPDGQSTGSSSG
ncbi:MAG TPA: sigma-70 family RNA polymerase sigma factor [Micromonospora sp.]